MGFGGIGAEVVVGIVVVDLQLGVAVGCTDLPRLGSNSCPPCSLDQVGAERRAPDATVQQNAEGAVCFADICYLWAGLGVCRRFPAGGMDPDCPRLAPLRKAGGRMTPDVAAANVAGDCLPELGILAPEGRFSVLTVACSVRSSATWTRRLCIPSPRLQCGCATTASCSQGCRREESAGAGRRQNSVTRGLLEGGVKGQVVAGSSGLTGRRTDVRSAYELHFVERVDRCIDPVRDREESVVAQRAAGHEQTRGGRQEAGIAALGRAR